MNHLDNLIWSKNKSYNSSINEIFKFCNLYNTKISILEKGVDIDLIIGEILICNITEYNNQYRNLREQSKQIIKTIIDSRIYKYDKIINVKNNSNKYVVNNIDPISSNNLFYSISYSNSFFTIALSNYSKIGVDIEEIKLIEDYELIKQLALSKEEIDNCNSLTDFYSFWTKKEAYLKSVGIGIHDNLQSVTDYSNCYTIYSPYPNLMCSISIL